MRRRLRRHPQQRVARVTVKRATLATLVSRVPRARTTHSGVPSTKPEAS